MTRTVRQGETKEGMGATRAAGARQFVDLQEVKDSRDSIVPTEELAKLKDKLEVRFVELRTALSPYHEDQRYDALERAFVDFYSSDKKRTKFGIPPRPAVRRSIARLPPRMVRRIGVSVPPSSTKVSRTHWLNASATPAPRIAGCTLRSPA